MLGRDGSSFSLHNLVDVWLDDLFDLGVVLVSADVDVQVACAAPQSVDIRQ